MDEAIIRRYSASVPRYTSYPTAVQFSDRVGPSDHAAWLGRLPAAASLSLYLHIPFCQELCLYCACATKAVRRYEPVAEYLPGLAAEIGRVAGLVPARHVVRSIHWGGGSPSILTPADIARLAEWLRTAFRLAPDCELAVEVDPRWIDAEKVAALAAAGLTRVSLGVQDFAPEVQAAIGRRQDLATTRQVLEMFRAEGVASANIDLVYGLPHQTLTSLEATIGQVVALAPDRLAVFGYAHVPHRAKHQRLIDIASLPGAVERFRQRARIAELLLAAGYRAVGMDHFARPDDALATAAVRRNFQGYTTDAAQATLGLGATAIGQLPGGYVQNAAATGEYLRRIAGGGLATARGFALAPEDRLRAHVIERLMCDFTFSAGDLRRRFGAAADPIIAEAGRLLRSDRDGLVAPTDDGFRCTPLGAAFVRVLCSRFDAYWGTGSERHALAV